MLLRKFPIGVNLRKNNRRDPSPVGWVERNGKGGVGVPNTRQIRVGVYPHKNAAKPNFILASETKTLGFSRFLLNVDG